MIWGPVRKVDNFGDSFQIKKDLEVFFQNDHAFNSIITYKQTQHTNNLQFIQDTLIFHNKVASRLSSHSVHNH